MTKRKLFFATFLNLAILMIPSLLLAQDQPSSVKEVAFSQLDTVRKLFDLLTEFIVKYSFQVLGGIVVLVIGWIVGGYAERFFAKFLKEKNVDVTVAKFIASSLKILVLTFAVIVALGKFGIDIAPLIAGVSVAGFGLSFALQGPLSNYASGATLIFTKPFKVGDIIEVAGVVGEVLDLKLPRTEIKTIDGHMVVIPNKHIIGEIIHNYSDTKKVDITVGVSYKSDLDKVIKIVRDVVSADPRVTKKAKIGISEFADSSINIYARVWCKQDQYWDVLFDINKNIFDEFKKQGVEIPFPQRDVHLIKES